MREGSLWDKVSFYDPAPAQFFHVIPSFQITDAYKKPKSIFALVFLFNFTDG